MSSSFRGIRANIGGSIPASSMRNVAARIPVRTNRDDRYFTDSYQFMPRYGYAEMFARILDHPNITLRLETEFNDIRDHVQYREACLYRPDRRILRISIRQAAVSLIAFRRSASGEGICATDCPDQFSERPRIHADHRVQTPHRAGSCGHDDRLRVPDIGGRSVLPNSTARERRRL